MSYIKKFFEIFFSLAGTLLSVYVGGYWLLFRPLRNIYLAYTVGSITWHLLFNSFIRIFLSATVAGGIWCLFDIIAGFFRDIEE